MPLKITSVEYEIIQVENYDDLRYLFSELKQLVNSGLKVTVKVNGHGKPKENLLSSSWQPSTIIDFTTHSETV